MCLTVCDPMDYSTPGFPGLHYFPKFVRTHVHRVGDAIQPFHLLSSPSPLALNFPGSGSFPVSQLFAIRCAKYRSFSFSISPSHEYSGLISFRANWFDHLSVQETLKSLIQHHSSEASIFGIQPSLWSNYHIPTKGGPSMAKGT